jgi:hypothetical protein
MVPLSFYARTGMDLAAWHTWWKRRGAYEINEILWDRWDPICAGFDPPIKPPKDEYASYAGTVGGMLREGASAEEIARYLEETERDYIGLGHADDRTDLAREIVDWFQQEMRNAEA